MWRFKVVFGRVFWGLVGDTFRALVVFGIALNFGFAGGLI